MAASMSADVSHVAGWVLVMIAIVVFSIVMRDLLLMHAERVALEEERKKIARLRAEAHEAEHVNSMLD